MFFWWSKESVRLSSYPIKDTTESQESLAKRPRNEMSSAVKLTISLAHNDDAIFFFELDKGEGEVFPC